MSFAKSLATHVALKAALAQGLFKSSPVMERTARSIIAGNNVPGGPIVRRSRLVRLLAANPSSLETIVRKMKISRRTVFRDLNELEECGITVELVGNKYKAYPGSLARHLK